MFNSQRKEGSREIQPQTYANASTVIARGVKVEGDFNSEGDVVIEGQVKGSLKTTASLTVGSEAVINANVKASTANVSGTIEGHITVENELIVTSSAKIVGDITAETLSVERGAKMEGKVSIGQPAGAGSSEKAASSYNPSKKKDGSADKTSEKKAGTDDKEES